MTLTAVGKRTLAGFKAKYGDKAGGVKFKEAIDKGLIDRATMENVGLADDGAQATPGNPSGGGQPLPKGGGVGRAAGGAFQKRPG